MPYTLSVSADGAYIILKVTGQITRSSQMASNIENHALGKKLGINRFLVDVTEARNVDTVSDNYQFAYEDMHIPEINPGVRVAILASPGDHSHDIVETVLRNAGQAVTLFTDPEAAKRYLLGP
jgi:hypothetical protein